MTSSHGIREADVVSIDVMVEAESVHGVTTLSLSCAADAPLENVMVVWCVQHALALHKVTFCDGDYEISPADTPVTLQWLGCQGPVIIKAFPRLDLEAGLGVEAKHGVLVGNVVSVHGSDSEVSVTP